MAVRGVDKDGFKSFQTTKKCTERRARSREGGSEGSQNLGRRDKER